MIEIREKESDGCSVALAEGDGARQLPEEAPPVQEMSERILLGERFQQRSMGPHLGEFSRQSLDFAAQGGDLGAHVLTV